MERDPLAGRILPTALTLFGEHGYHGTSMPAVQADTDVGVRLRTVYDRITGAVAATSSGPDRELRAACALGAVSAGVIHGGGSADQQPLILAAAQAVLASSVPVP